MGEIEELIQKVIEFRNKRDWKQFHNSKDLAIALSIEASELLESFLWKEAEEANPNDIKEELADILMYALLLAHEEDLDIDQIVNDKLSKNDAKYPISKSKGKSSKYTEL